MAYAISALQPSLVVIENVRGILSAAAHSDLEPCSWCLGEESGTVLRALGAVAGDLADLGYDCRWSTVRAADAGACHGRARVFIIAQPARDTSSEGREGSAWSKFQFWQLAQLFGAAPDAESLGRSTWRAGSEEQSRSGRQSASDLTTPADANVSSSETRITSADRVGRGSAVRQLQPLGSPAAADVVDFGPYADAVDRHARAVGRPAPAPTEPGKTGPRLSPLFVEWMMMLPAGHVTDAAIGLSRAQQLKALGNGVVPDQAALALRILLSGNASMSALMANPTASEMAWGVRDE